MASILQELYYGNITPNARGVKRGSAYTKAGNKMTEAQQARIIDVIRRCFD